MEGIMKDETYLGSRKRYDEFICKCSKCHGQIMIFAGRNKYTTCHICGNISKDRVYVLSSASYKNIKNRGLQF